MPAVRLDALAIGDAILDIVTPPIAPGLGDRQSHVDRFFHLPGGNATNFALAFAALGGRTGFIGCVGRDWAGTILRDAYRHGRVRTHLRISPSKPSGTTLALTFSDGTRHLVTSRGANADLRPSDVPTSWIAAARHVHRAGYWWATRLIGPPTVRLLRRARAMGATTSLDVSTDPQGWPQHRRDAILSTLPHVNTFFGNEEEVMRIADRGPLEEAAQALLRSGVREVIVHQGSHGATVFTKTEVVSDPAVPVAPLNPTGCGDVFNAGYIRAAMAGADVVHRLRLANAAAALHLENIAKPYPTLRDLRSRLNVSLPVDRRGRVRR
ncbi:MAG TPA: carbohydrate kinase family protein [Thermoplasmata archaeon]